MTMCLLFIDVSNGIPDSFVCQHRQDRTKDFIAHKHRFRVFNVCDQRRANVSFFSVHVTPNDNVTTISVVYQSSHMVKMIHRDQTCKIRGGLWTVAKPKLDRTTKGVNEGEEFGFMDQYVVRSHTSLKEERSVVRSRRKRDGERAYLATVIELSKGNPLSHNIDIHIFGDNSRAVCRKGRSVRMDARAWMGSYHFPPSSRVTGVRCFAEASMIILPTRGLPV